MEWSDEALRLLTETCPTCGGLDGECEQCDDGVVLTAGVVPLFRQGGLTGAYYRDDDPGPHDGYYVPAYLLAED